MSDRSLDSVRRGIVQMLISVSDNAPFEARELLVFALKTRKEALFIDGNLSLSEAQINTIDSLAKRRLEGEPLAYILGEWQFYGLDLIVSPGTLIPRPETESLVDYVLARSLKDESRVIDLGTGSGAIALALQHERPNWRVMASDISHEALSIAKQNAEAHQLNNIEFINSDWWSTIPSELRFDIIIANPPYIDRDDLLIDDSVRLFEPELALYAEHNGIAAIEAILSEAANRMNEHGLIVLEHGFQQAASVRGLMKHYKFSNIATHLDVKGLERFTIAYAN